ncbi:MAG: tripartite tricarboxylate transporter substrate binding protein [Deltaproteobacteria bacterium]|nr:tripartite tricarboxylate transporter substrate binding protein [Deltaproteobacteria bacterium]
MKRKCFSSGIVVLAAFLAMSSIGFTEDKFPQKDATLIMPYSPGGGTDVMGRTISRIIEKYNLYPKEIAVVNKPGGGGAVGKAYVMKQRPDGYTITAADIGNAIYPIVVPSTKWKTDDWVYLANMVFDYNLICVKTGSYKDIDSLIKASKQSQAPLKAGGTSAAGGPDSMCSLKLNQAAGTKILYVPMKGGGEVITSLLGGHVDMVWANPSEIQGQIEAGKAVALAVAAEKRLASMPEVPTFRELGMDVYYAQQRGYCAKAGIPEEARVFWIDLLKKVRETTEWKDYLKKSSLEDGWLPGEEFRTWMHDAKDDFVKSLDALKKTMK